MTECDRASLSAEIARLEPGEIIVSDALFGEADLAGYVVLRGSGATGPLAAITPQPLSETTFTDTGIDNDADYRYAVRAVRVEPAVTAAGEASAAVAAAPRDTTPPSPPSACSAVVSASVTPIR